MRIVLIEMNGNNKPIDGIIQPLPLYQKDTEDHPQNTVDCFNHGLTLGNGHVLEPSEIYMVPNSRQGLELAISLKPQIVSMSLNGTFYPELEKELAKHAFMVTSAGNTGDDGEGFAARSDWWCAVGAVDRYDKPLWYSSYGLGKVKTVARLPIINGTERPGTSSTAPVVAGIIALFFSWYRSKTGQYPSKETVYQFIRENSHDIWEQGEDLRTGYGLLRTPKNYLATQLIIENGSQQGKLVKYKGDAISVKDVDIITKPLVQDNRIYVGVRGVFENTGAKVEYKNGKVIFSM